MQRLFSAFTHQSGQAILEYALIIAILVLGMAVAITDFGQSLIDDAWEAVQTLNG